MPVQKDFATAIVNAKATVFGPEITQRSSTATHAAGNVFVFSIPGNTPPDSIYAALVDGFTAALSQFQHIPYPRNFVITYKPQPAQGNSFAVSVTC